jgi:hypothetical protein
MILRTRPETGRTTKTEEAKRDISCLVLVSLMQVPIGLRSAVGTRNDSSQLSSSRKQGNIVLGRQWDRDYVHFQGQH